jgi:predicted nuclease of predicted toxin-antitoxin system
MASLFADENFPHPAVRRLRALGHDVLTVAEAGMVNRSIPDHIVLEYATRLGRAVVTLNWQDFVSLHHQEPSHAGIVVCEADADSFALALRIHTHLIAKASLAGALVEVSR